VAQYRQLERAQMKTKSFQFATDTRANERRRSREMAPRNAGQKGQKKRGRPTSVQQTQTHQTMRFSYQDLLATLLSFQLQEREAYLKHFLHLFQTVDTDGDGVVSNSQFTELYRRMRQRSIDEAQCFDVAVEWRTDCDRLLDLVDPYGQDRITFSDVVHLFGNTKRESLAPSK
jgi:Ca2+-binding EF-hand superfamily protein